MKFDFLKLNAIPSPAFPTRTHNYRPIINAHICSIDLPRRIHYYVLLDSGADYNLFHADLAELIGIKDYKSGKEQKMFGIEGDGIMSYFHDIIIEIGGWKYKAYSGFTDFEGKKSHDKMPYGILGQIGFFEYFNVSFDYSKVQIEIRPKDPSIFITGNKKESKAAILPASIQ